MLESLFDLPLLIAGPIIVGSLCLYGVIGLSIVRRYILPRLRSQDSYSDFAGAMLQAVMVFYGLAVALIAVSVWQSYSDAAKVSSQEATAAATLYRDLSGYAEPARSQLQKQLRDYVNQIIQQAWPMRLILKVPVA
jgi:nitrate reductase gamma subunit